MPLPVSALSSVCANVADFVRNGLNAAMNNISVTLGAPAIAAAGDTHRVNLFFYRFEPSGMQPDTHPNDPWRLRMYCLVTAFGIDEDDINAGENDLRMLGEILRLFHETPILAPLQVNGETIRLQVVFIPVTDDRINQIWSTQNDATYRPSVIYEMALAPIVPMRRRVLPPLAGTLGTQVLADMNQRHAPFTGTIHGVPVRFHQIDTTDPRWSPSLCWVHAGECAQALSFDVDSPEFAAFAPAIWLAGDAAAPVQLIWQRWNSQVGWGNVGAPVAAAPFTTFIDPDRVPPPQAGVFPLPVVLPVALAAGQRAAQAQLHATRIVNIPGQGPTVIRSEPILISLYRNVP
jgi:hypothetical protein